KPLSIHIEFETGMNRTGICTIEDLTHIVEKAKSLKQLKITGAYTHFATADDIQSEHYFSQRNRYHDMLGHLTSLLDHDIITHMGNSAAGIQYSGEMLDYTRFGVALYGLYPSSDIKSLGNVPLQQAMSLYSEIAQVKKVHAGEFVSYGAT